MNEQLSFDLPGVHPRKLARRDAPVTSKLAAASVSSFATAHHAAIVRAMQDYGSRGLTVHEIAAFCRLEAHAIGKRMNELERGKVVEVATAEVDGETVELTRESPSGRAARVWQLVKRA